MAHRLCDLREAVQLSGRAGLGRDAARPRGRRPIHGREGRPDVHLHVEEDIPLPHRRGGHSAELRGCLQPRRSAEPQVPRDGLHARDRRRLRSDRRQGGVNLGDPGARPLPAPDPADQAGRGLHRPTLDAVLLPGPAEHADRPGGDRQPGGVWPLLRLRASRKPAHRAQTQPVLPRRPAGERRPGRGDVRREPGSLPARRRARPDRLLRRFQHPPDRVQRVGGEVWHQPDGRAALRYPQARDLVPRLQPRPARVQGPRPDPAQEGDQLRHRPARAPAHRWLPRGQAHRPNAAAHARPPREHLPARRSEPRRGAALVREGTGEARHARPLHVERPIGRPPGSGVGVRPETTGHRPRCEVLRRAGPGGEGCRPAASRSTSSPGAG